MKRILYLMLILILTIPFFTPRPADAKLVNQNTINADLAVENLIKVLKSKKWDSLPDLYSSEMKDEIRHFYSDNLISDNQLGFFNIKSLRLIDFKLIPKEKDSFYA